MLSPKPVFTFSGGNVRQDNTDVPHYPPVIISKLLTRLKANQDTIGAVEVSKYTTLLDCYE